MQGKYCATLSYDNFIVLHVVVLMLVDRPKLCRVNSSRISPRAPTSAREAMLSQGASSRTKKPKQMARSGSFPSGGSRYRSSRHQGGQLSKDDAVHDLTYTLGASDRSSSYPVPPPCFSRSNSSSLLSSSDAGSSCTFSSDSTDSTRNTGMEYDHIFGASGYMCPVSPAVIPEEDKLSYLRQRSSWNPNSSGHDMDEEAGKFARQYQRRYRQAGTGRGARVDSGGETTSTSLSYADQGKYQGSSRRRNRSSFGSSCKLTEQRRNTGPAFFLEGRLGRGLSKYFYFTDIQGGLGLGL